MKITKSELREMIKEAVLKEQTAEKPTDVLSLEVVERYLKEALSKVKEGKYWAAAPERSEAFGFPDDARKAREEYKNSLRKIKTELQHAINLIDNIGGRT